MNESFEWDDEPPEPPEPQPYLPTVMDAAVAPDDVAAWACSIRPGSAATTPLAVIDPRRLSPEGLVDFIAACERHVSWFLAMQYQALAVMAEDPTVPTLPGEQGKDWVREEVTCALKLSFNTAASRLALARELTGRLPGTLDLQHRGQITTHHSRSLAEATMSLDDTATTKVEEAVLAKAPEQTLASFRRSLRRAVLTAAPQTVQERHAKGMAERRVVRMPADDTGMSGIWMLLPDAGASVLMTAIDALGRRVTSTDPRTADQRRADAIIQLALDTLHGTRSGELPREHGMRPTIHVCVALSTLLNLDEEPGELAGSGPIPASLARKLAADPTGTWRRLVTDPLGTLIDYGHTRYKPPQTPGRSRHRPRPHLPLPVLQPASLRLRLGSSNPVGTRREDERGQPAMPVLPTPPGQTRSRLATRTTARRHDRMDQPDQAQVPRRTSHLPHRSHHATQPTVEPGEPGSTDPDPPPF